MRRSEEGLSRMIRGVSDLSGVISALLSLLTGIVKDVELAG